MLNHTVGKDDEQISRVVVF